MITSTQNTDAWLATLATTDETATLARAENVVTDAETGWRYLSTDPERTRLTDCCGAWSSYSGDGILCCKACYQPVGVGQGDGSDTVPNDRYLPAGETRILSCQMDDACTKTVTHIDNKGFVYCHDHGVARKRDKPCRKMSRAEIKRLEAGLTISYTRERKKRTPAPVVPTLPNTSDLRPAEAAAVARGDVVCADGGWSVPAWLVSPLARLGTPGAVWILDNEEQGDALRYVVTRVWPAEDDDGDPTYPMLPYEYGRLVDGENAVHVTDGEYRTMDEAVAFARLVYVFGLAQDELTCGADEEAETLSNAAFALATEYGWHYEADDDFMGWAVRATQGEILARALVCIAAAGPPPAPVPTFGIPYASTHFDADGAYVVCPVCSETIRLTTPKDADSMSTRPYADHYAANHTEHR